ncbi:MAG: phosphatase PAP2 family protein, partial [Bacilli bacterium]
RSKNSMRVFRDFVMQKDRSAVLFCNSYFSRCWLNKFFSTITHLGGATFTVVLALSTMFLFKGEMRSVAVASFWSLTISHLIVQILKRTTKRKRPYLVLESIQFHPNPLVDASLPSGHTTAISSLLLPYCFYDATSALIFAPIMALIGFSRMYLGLHFLSDVFVGFSIATITSVCTYIFFV